MSKLLELLMVFGNIGCFSIGGGYAIIPLIQDQVVTQLNWLSQKAFTDIITISQMTPGPLAVNTSTFVGIQVAGIPGAIAATFGCVITGVLLSLCMARLFYKHSSSVYLYQILNGLKTASLGLIASAAVTILAIAFRGAETAVDWYAVLLFMVSLFLLRKKKVGPIPLILLNGAAGMILYG